MSISGNHKLTSAADGRYKALKEVEQTLGEVCHSPSTASHGSPTVNTEQSRNIKLIYICKGNTRFVRLRVAESGVRRFLLNVLVYI